jgi:predicted nucleic acid-binding Zn ribbon protein
MAIYRVRCEDCGNEEEVRITFSEFDRFKARDTRLVATRCLRCRVTALVVVPSAFTFTI